jgi:hypothetical protein
MTAKERTMSAMKITSTGLMYLTPERAKAALDLYGKNNKCTFERTNGSAQHSGVVIGNRKKAVIPCINSQGAEKGSNATKEYHLLSQRDTIDGSHWLIAAVVGGLGETRFVPTVIGNVLSMLDESDCEDEGDRESLHSTMDDIRLRFAMSGITFIG